MQDPARSPTDVGWGRARAAYSTLIAAHDPCVREVGRGAIDLRPGFAEGELERSMPAGGVAVVSGPSDLIELRTVIERLAGPGTWPACGLPPGFVVVETRTAAIELDRPAPALGLIMAMEHLIEDRSRAWRTWKTMVESLAMGVPAGMPMSVEALVVTRA